MVYSMTGFGKAKGEIDGVTFGVEVKSLNSKYLDVQIKGLSGQYEQEFAVRELVKSKLSRGKIEVSITFESGHEAMQYEINEPAVTAMANQASKLTNNGVKPEQLLSAILQLPVAIKENTFEFTEERWKALVDLIEQALGRLLDFRQQEGKKLQADLEQNTRHIAELAVEVASLAPQRIDKIRNRVVSQIEELVDKAAVDENRIEQELIFYVEKLDINEEQVRLKAHCDYFIETLNNKEVQDKGKKLGFISQEMGREVNTMGAKSNDAEMQRRVVQMKEDIDKIKEQSMNVL